MIEAAKARETPAVGLFLGAKNSVCDNLWPLGHAGDPVLSMTDLPPPQEWPAQVQPDQHRWPKEIVSVLLLIYIFVFYCDDKRARFI